MTDMSLHGKTAIITGSAGGMGRIYAHRLADRGADIVIADIDLGAGKRWGEVDESVEAEVRNRGVRAVSVEADLSTRAGAKEVIEAAMATFGRVDVLVNNAGGAITPAERSKATTVPDQDIEKLMGANFFSTLYCCQEAAPVLTRPGASIINIATFGVHGISNGGIYAVYVAAKAAVVQLTKSLAVELGPEGVRVNAVAPGLILTGRARAQAAERGIGTPDQHELIPMRHLGSPEEMAGAVEFFASEGSSYVTGQLLTVDGGASQVSVI